MVVRSRPRSAEVREPPKHTTLPARTSAAEKTCLRSSKSQPIAVTGGTIADQSQPFRTTSQPTSTTTHYGAAAAKMARSGQNRKSKVLNWYRLPATGGWVPSARAVSPSFLCDHALPYGSLHQLFCRPSHISNRWQPPRGRPCKAGYCYCCTRKLWKSPIRILV